MIIYRKHSLTEQLFRRAVGYPEEYIAKDKEWKLTADAVEAFHDSSDTYKIDEKEAIETMEKQNRSLEV